MRQKAPLLKPPPLRKFHLKSAHHCMAFCFLHNDPPWPPPLYNILVVPPRCANFIWNLHNDPPRTTPPLRKIHVHPFWQDPAGCARSMFTHCARSMFLPTAQDPCPPTAQDPCPPNYGRSMSLETCPLYFKIDGSWPLQSGSNWEGKNTEHNYLPWNKIWRRKLILARTALPTKKRCQPQYIKHYRVPQK